MMHVLDTMNNAGKITGGVKCNSKYFSVSSFMKIILNCSVNDTLNSSFKFKTNQPINQSIDQQQKEKESGARIIWTKVLTFKKIPEIGKKTVMKMEMDILGKEDIKICPSI